MIAPLAIRACASIEGRPRDYQASGTRSFAAFLQTAGFASSGENFNMEQSSPAAVLRFDEASIFGRRHDAKSRATDRDGPPVGTMARVDGDVSALAPEAPCPPSGPFSPTSTDRIAHAGAVARPRATGGAFSPTHANTIAPVPDRSSKMSDATPDVTRSLKPRCTPLRRSASRVSAAMVSLHATEGELLVHARPGRMTPTERERLRNAIGALLCEYGLFGATVRVEENLGAHHG